MTRRSHGDFTPLPDRLLLIVAAVALTLRFTGVI